MASYQVLFAAAIAMVMFSSAYGQYNQQYQQPQYHQPQYQEQYAEPKYSFEYHVADEHTGDYHSQQESRDGHAVKGYYDLIQPDGHKRIVEYTADEKTGFVANVHYEPVQGYKAPAPQYSAPSYKYAPAPPKYQAYSPKY